jgi:hypothetical protein
LSVLRTGRLYPQEIFPLLVSVRDRVNPRATGRPEGLCQLKFPMTPSGFETATFRTVVQSLNQVPRLVALENSDVHPIRETSTKLKRIGTTHKVQIISQPWLKFRVWICRFLQLQLQSCERGTSLLVALRNCRMYPYYRKHRDNQSPSAN